MGHRGGWGLIALAALAVLPAVPAYADDARAGAPTGSGIAASPPQATQAGRGTAEAFLMGNESNTGYRDIFTGIWHLLTGQRVGYRGAADGSSPRVGDVYQGVSEFFNYGNPLDPAGVTTLTVEVALPPGTIPAVHASDPNRRIQCFWFQPASNTSGEFTGSTHAGNACPTTLTPGGIYGHRLLPSTNSGQFRIPPGIGFAVIYPLISSQPLAGYGGLPGPHCMVGSISAGGGGTPDGRVWDAPTPGENCPLPQYHGADVPVQVAPRRGGAPGAGNSAPEIRGLRPRSGSTVRTARVRIRAIVSDAETDLARGRIRLRIDGRRISDFRYRRSTDVLTHRTDTLARGSHRVTIVARDAQGQRTTRSTTFRVVR